MVIVLVFSNKRCCEFEINLQFTSERNFDKMTLAQDVKVIIFWYFLVHHFNVYLDNTSANK